jgi:hypothetical protein
MIQRRPLAVSLLAAFLAGLALTGCQKEEAKKPEGIPEKFRITVTVYKSQPTAAGNAEFTAFHQRSNGCMPFDAARQSALIGPYNCTVRFPNPLLGDQDARFVVMMAVLPQADDDGWVRVVAQASHMDIGERPSVIWREHAGHYVVEQGSMRARFGSLASPPTDITTFDGVQKAVRNNLALLGAVRLSKQDRSFKFIVTVEKDIR